MKLRNIFNLGIGTDNLLHADGRRRITGSVEVANLTNLAALYSFLSTFSGTDAACETPLSESDPGPRSSESAFRERPRRGHTRRGQLCPSTIGATPKDGPKLKMERYAISVAVYPVTGGLAGPPGHAADHPSGRVAKGRRPRDP